MSPYDVVVCREQWKKGKDTNGVVFYAAIDKHNSRACCCVPFPIVVFDIVASSG